MSYTIHISEESFEGQALASVAAREHVSIDEAALRLLRRGASENESPVQEVARLRAQKAQRLAGVQSSPEDAVKLIGLLANDPDAVAAIREASRERHSEMYGE